MAGRCYNSAASASFIMDPLALLARPDKWYLGAGDGLIWAPPFPAWHDTPGFWDDAHLAQIPVGPLFSLSFVDDLGVPVGGIPRAHEIQWTPADLTLDYQIGPGLKAQEVRAAPGDRWLVSDWALRSTARRARVVHLVVWTAVFGESVLEEGVALHPQGLRLHRTLSDRKNQETPVALDYRLTGATSRAAYRSEHSGPAPDFRLTPFYDRWDAKRGLGDAIGLGGIDRRGLVYLGLHRRIRLEPGATVRFAAGVRVEPLRGLTPTGGDQPAAAPPRVTQARKAWRSFAATVPEFRSSDPFFQHQWWYRWYGLRLNRIPAGLGQYRDTTVCEGIGYFHQPISYSAMCHARELRWLRDGAWARGVIDTFFDRLHEDGSMPGRVYLDHLVEPDFYHADWGGAVADLAASHPDVRWLRARYPALAAYANWLVATRDRDGSGMIDVTDQYETGQEYMSRYEAVDPEADRYGWENRIRLKGIDVTVYAWRLYRLLARIAPDPGGRSLWKDQADRSARAIRERMWDAELEMFSDVNPATGEGTRVKAAVCFYPYLTELAGEEHLAGMERHLFNPGEFWTPFPVPSSSVDDPRFSAEAEWKGKRHVCPWNGRVWPMTNSHIVDALARVVRLHRPAWAPRLVHLLRQFARMLTFDGDPARPNCFEHYHPFTGRASVYRGIDDYQHSWINDLLARHVAGVLPQGEAGLLVDPLPFGGSTELHGAVVSGRRVDVVVRDGAFQVRIDGRPAGRSRVGRALEVQL